MVPSEDVVALSTTVSVEENFDRIQDTPHTRFPLIGADLTDLQGIVYAPSIITNIDGLREGDVTFEEVATPPMTLSVDTTVSDAFDQFQAQGQELALVIQHGEVVGLLTATDTLEAVMGQLEDPLDSEL